MMNNHSAKYSAFRLVFLPGSPVFTPCAIFVLLNQIKDKIGCIFAYGIGFYFAALLAGLLRCKKRQCLRWHEK